ncbi:MULTISPECIES: DoxX family protein [Pseudarthrobacter]|jgi:putative oxidoreductase|uniref:Oxidoreductase n=1 Tax=Pseudarthrobacter niigatensis TaxID=369935 RepID=A0AAJ1STR2_9MICC|nr:MULTISPECIES: DoxX family protein [Pseudarthrobacter]MDQ0147026.1 putative oxidoreductase [Pseudarthrobacter niigatensis]MDQ0267346.1 putative oxidoreductase [Pseudarthrobacter niigatensis]QDG61835.1 DoxX family protein [Pseudarthrobacter sp. NIBRBAC000502771]
MNKSALTTTALAALRIILGFLFAAHGWQKFNEWTIAGTQASFAKMGVPAADVMAPAIAVLELAGGIALILGILTRVVAALLVVDMLGALFLVHAPAGIFAANGGYELVLLLAAASFALALTGAGRLSVDRALFGRRPESRLAVLA